jgi:hypothetical protein
MATYFCQTEPEAMFVQKAGAWHFVQGMGGGGLVGGHNLTLSIDNQRNGLETHAKVDATSVIRFVWNPVTSL